MKIVSIFLIVILLLAGTDSAFAHKNGCHSKHSCPSDSGSYTCGDKGYCSQCSDNNYCKAGQPRSSGSSDSSSSDKTSSKSVTCDQTLWNHIYHPSRLKIIENCKTVSGIIKKIISEKDGDYHIRLTLDSQFANLINDANRKNQHGDLVVEVICQKKVTQQDAIQSCSNFKNKINIPPVGSHVSVTGSYVLDTQHGGWAEIHPVTKIQIIK